jgi:Effector-associated domain 11
MKRHLRFTYNLMFYRSIESVKEEFFSEYHMTNQLLRDYSLGFPSNKKISIDKANETITVYRSDYYLKQFGGSESYELSFEKYIIDKIWEEFSDLISEIDESYWEHKDEQFSSFLEKIKVDINFITTQMHNYWDSQYSENKICSSSESIFTYIETMLERVENHLKNKYSSTEIKKLDELLISENIYDKEELRKQVIENKLEFVLQKLREYFTNENDSKNECIMCLARLNDYEKKANIIGKENQEEINQIRINILKLIDKIA